MIFGKLVNRYYFKHFPRLLIGIISLVVVDFLQLRIPEIYRTLLDCLSGESDVNFTMDFLLDDICKPLLIVIFLIVICRFIWRICFFIAGIKVETDIRDRMFDHCKDLSRQYYQLNKVGNLMSFFTNDLDTVSECFSDGILMVCDATFLGALALIKMFRMNVTLTLLSMIPMVLLFSASTIVGKKISSQWDKRQQAFSDLSDFSQESFSGIAVIKAFVKESKEIIAFRKLNKDNENANVEYVKISTLFSILVQLFIQAVVCVILGYGGYLVFKGASAGGFTGGQLHEFSGYFSSTIWPVMAVAQLIDMASRGKASRDRLTTLLETKQDVFDKDDVAEPTEPIKGSIEFRNLSFTYPDGETEALKNISFKLEAGQSLGIVGRTGCGKTTIVDLILRNYNVPDGTLFIDGYDVNKIPIRTIRECCAYVPQDNFLFSDTIVKNIAFGMDIDDAVYAQSRQSAVISDVDGDISEFEHQYDTILGERGVTVSGGQKQRISIARALMKKAPVLILDDSVSAVDTDTEKKILEGLNEDSINRTTILVAHRISTVQNMDRILMIDDGEVVDFGTHDELLERCEPYRHMVELQKLEEEENHRA